MDVDESGVSAVERLSVKRTAREDDEVDTGQAQESLILVF